MFKSQKIKTVGILLIFESLIAEKTSSSFLKNSIQTTAINLWQPYYLFLSTLESAK